MNTFEAIHGGENHRLWIGGHRGHASATRENTTANFAEVLGMGAWAWAGGAVVLLLTGLSGFARR